MTFESCPPLTVDLQFKQFLPLKWRRTLHYARFIYSEWNNITIRSFCCCKKIIATSGNGTVLTK